MIITPLPAFSGDRFDPREKRRDESSHEPVDYKVGPSYIAICVQPDRKECPYLLGRGIEQL